MANEEKKIWGIHTTDDSLFLHNDVIAIGWQDFGDCGKLEPNREAYKAHYIDTYPDSKKGGHRYQCRDAVSVCCRSENR